MVIKREYRINLPNEPGQLARITETLGVRGINILAVTAIRSADPVVALVTDQDDATRGALGDLGLSFEEVDLLVVDVPHKPGELGIMMKKLGDAGINIESSYLLEEADGQVRVAITVSDLDKAKEVIGQS